MSRFPQIIRHFCEHPILSNNRFQAIFHENRNSKTFASENDASDPLLLWYNSVFSASCFRAKDHPSISFEDSLGQLHRAQKRLNGKKQSGIVQDLHERISAAHIVLACDSRADPKMFVGKLRAESFSILRLFGQKQIPMLRRPEAGGKHILCPIAGNAGAKQILNLQEKLNNWGGPFGTQP